MTGGRGAGRSSPAGGAWVLFHLMAGPALFLLLLAWPWGSLPYPVRGSLGLLLWMGWWWVAGAVHLAVTGFLPLVVVALFGFVPVKYILPAYAGEMVILLLGASILATAWSRWGLDRRMALHALLRVGTGTRRQIMVWFLVSAVMSMVLPNTVVAAALMPVVVAMLQFVGVEDRAKSVFATGVGLAVAWGASVGGMATPLGGAPNLLVVEFLEKSVLKHEFLFSSWVGQMAPLVLAAGGSSLLFLRFAFRPQQSQVAESRAYFAAELRRLGDLKVPERWALLLFLAALVLVFARSLYASFLPELHPAFVFLILAVACFIIRHKGEPLLRWEYAQSRMVWGLFYLFAGGAALGRLLDLTGTSRAMAAILAPLAGGGEIGAVVVFSLLALVMTQVTSNTAAAAITIPVTISACQALDLNPLQPVIIVTAVANCGLMLPSSSGGPAIAAAYGINLKTMFSRGLLLSILLWLVIVALGSLRILLWPA